MTEWKGDSCPEVDGNSDSIGKTPFASGKVKGTSDLPVEVSSVSSWNVKADTAYEESFLGYNALIREFNVFKLRDFFPKRPSKITIKRDLATGQITILVERAGVTRIHPAESVEGAFCGGKVSKGNGNESSTPNGDDNVTFHIKYFNDKVDYFESHYRDEICGALNKALATASSTGGMVDSPYDGSPQNSRESSSKSNGSSMQGIRNEAMLCSPISRSVGTHGGIYLESQRSHSLSGDRRSSSTHDIREELQDFFGV